MKRNYEDAFNRHLTAAVSAASNFVYKDNSNARDLSFGDDKRNESPKKQKIYYDIRDLLRAVNEEWCAINLPEARSENFKGFKESDIVMATVIEADSNSSSNLHPITASKNRMSELQKLLKDMTCCRKQVEETMIINATIGGARKLLERSNKLSKPRGCRDRRQSLRHRIGKTLPKKITKDYMERWQQKQQESRLHKKPLPSPWITIPLVLIDI